MAEKLLLSPDEVGEAIGLKKSAMAKLLARGDIPSFKVGHLRKIPVGALAKWVRERENGANPGDEAA